MFAPAVVETAVRVGAPVGAAGAESGMLMRCDGCTTTLNVTGALGATGAGATPTLRAAGAMGATGLPHILSTGAVPAEVEAPVRAEASGAVVTGGVVVRGGAIVTDGSVVNGGAVVTDGVLVTGGAGSGCARPRGGAGMGFGAVVGSSCRTIVLSSTVEDPKYVSVIQITAPHNTMAKRTVRARYAAMRLRRLNEEVVLKGPYPSVCSKASVCACAALEFN